jgi:hypothetical protein
MDVLSFELFYKVNHKGTAHEMWESIKHTFGDSSTWDDGKFKEDVPKVEVHEDVEHIHNTVIVEDHSTSWSSDDDDRSTISSLDKVDGDASSDANNYSMCLKMVHAQDIIVMLLQAHLLHHSASCHKVTPRHLLVYFNAHSKDPQAHVDTAVTFTRRF